MATQAEDAEEAIACCSAAISRVVAQKLGWVLSAIGVPMWLEVGD